MIPSFIGPLLRKSLKNVPVVTLLGPRQAGKTTLVQKISNWKPFEYLGLESEIALAKLNQKKLFLSGFHKKLLNIF